MLQFEKPIYKITDTIESNFYGRFEIEPLERGFGTTIGNALRRVMLSSLPGCAISSIKIDGVLHEFQTIEGVYEDVTTIILNLKGVVFKNYSNEAKVVHIHATKEGEITAGDIEHDADIEVINKDKVIATLSKGATLDMEMTVTNGRGYVKSVIDGDPIDLARLAQIGSEGVMCLMSDSTNAERPGYTESESKVGESFDRLFRSAGNRRIIVATFASNIHRVQQIINSAASLGRKVALSGRSLENVVAVAKELGYIDVPDGLIVSLDTLKRYPEDKMVIITTGSQGEPMSALSRMAFSDHRKVEVGPLDYIIISATPIPGNEKTVGKVVNELMKLGAEVIYEKMYDVHVSGHACQEELKMIMSLVKPQYFIPVHGEQKHLQKHRILAESMGIDRKNIIIADNGILVEMTDGGIRVAGSVPAGKVYVDGSGVGDVGNIVLRDRKHLSQDGIIIITASVEADTGYIVSGPEIITRGFVYVKESEELIEQAKRIAYDTLDERLGRNPSDLVAAKTRVRDDISRFVFDKTKRSPMIVPIIMEV